jgi:hypothetical protein
MLWGVTVILRIPPWKLDLISLEPIVPVTFDVVLCSSSLSDSLFHLSKNIAELLLWHYPHDGHLVPVNVDIDDLWSFKVTFLFWEKPLSDTGSKSGEYGGWSNFVIDFVAKNSCSLSLSWPGVLLWCKMKAPDQSRGPLWWAASHNLTRIPRGNAGSLFDLVQETQS